MAFKDLDDFLVVRPVVLPIRGKDYSFPGEISGRTWLKVHSLSGQVQQAIATQKAGGKFDPDVEAISDMDQDELLAELCGDTLQEMIDDGLTSAHLDAVMAALMAFHMADRGTAEAVWNASGEAPAPNRSARRAKAPPSRARGSRAGSSAPKKAALRGRASSKSGS